MDQKMNKKEAIKKAQGLIEEVKDLKDEFGFKNEEIPGIKLLTEVEDPIDKAAKQFITMVVIPAFRRSYEKQRERWARESSWKKDYAETFYLDSWNLAYGIRLKLESMDLGLHAKIDSVGCGGYSHPQPHIDIVKYKAEKKALELLKSNPEVKIEDKANPGHQNQTTEKDYNSMTTREKIEHIRDGNVTDFSVVIRSSATSKSEKWEAWGRLMSCKRDSVFRHELRFIAENENVPSRMKRAARKMLTRL